MTIEIKSELTVPPSKTKDRADNPWKDAKWFINGAEVPEGAPVALWRGQHKSNTVKLVVPELDGTKISLDWINGEGLSVQAEPAFGDWVELVGGSALWDITPDEFKSGHLTLVVLSREVVSTLERRCWVMAEDLSEEVEAVLVNGVTPPPVFFRNEPRPVTVTYKPGSPLADYPLELLGKPLTGVQPGNLVVTSTGTHAWSVNAHTNSGTFELELKGAGMSKSIVLPVCKVLSRELADEATVQIDGEDALAGTVYFRGGVHTLTLDYKPDSPLAGYPVGLWWPSPLLTIVPAPATYTGEHTWQIKLADDQSGLFNLELAGKDFGRGNIKIYGNKLLSSNLADEAEFNFTGYSEPTSWFLLPWRTPRNLWLTYKPGSPLQDYPLELKIVLLSGLQPGDVVATPGGAHDWVMTGENRLGAFRLELTGAGMTTGIALPNCKVVPSQ